MAALLAAAVLGGFGAEAGSWIAWRTAAAIPSDRELRALDAALTGIPADARLYNQTSAQQGTIVLIDADGTAGWSASRPASPPPRPAYWFYRDAYEVMVYPHGSPDPYSVFGSHGATLMLSCTVAGLLAIVAAVIAARPRSAVQAG